MVTELFERESSVILSAVSVSANAARHCFVTLADMLNLDTVTTQTKSSYKDVNKSHETKASCTLFIQCIICIIHERLYVSIVVLSKSSDHHSKHYAQRREEERLGVYRGNVVIVWWAIHIQDATPLLCSWPESHPRDEIRQQWVDSDCNRDKEYRPSPRCSPSQTGPNGPGSWAGPGTGTGSARKETECL